MEEVDEKLVEKYMEDFTVPGTDELKVPEAWAHAHTNILKAGRVTH